MNETLSIHLNSSNATKYYNGSFNSQVEFILPHINIPSDYTIYLNIAHVSIPYSFYNINTSNNVLKYSVLSTIYTIIIPVGNYTVNNLLTQLKALFPSDFTITYNGINNKFSFTHSAQDFVFIFDINSIQSSCFGILGFSKNYQYSMNKVLTSDTMANLCPTCCLCISSTFLTQNISSISLNNSSILCSIPITVNPYTIISYSNSLFKVNLNTNILNAIQIKLSDQDGVLLDFNSIHWSITLNLELVNYVN
jgi:hypothetical protein